MLRLFLVSLDKRANVSLSSSDSAFRVILNTRETLKRQKSLKQKDTEQKFTKDLGKSIQQFGI